MAGSETPTLSACLPDELARTAMERAKLYGLLANLFRREPGADLLTQLRSPDFTICSARTASIWAMIFSTIRWTTSVTG
jgi:hypothetical protein